MKKTTTKKTLSGKQYRNDEDGLYTIDSFFQQQVEKFFSQSDISLPIEKESIY